MLYLRLRINIVKLTDAPILKRKQWQCYYCGKMFLRPMPHKCRGQWRKNFHRKWRNIMDLIEKMKKNEKPFGLLQPEEQECLKKVRNKNCVFYTVDGDWEDTAGLDSFCIGQVYRIKPDYQPEVGVAKGVPIVWNDVNEVLPKEPTDYLCAEVSGEGFHNIYIAHTWSKADGFYIKTGEDKGDEARAFPTHWAKITVPEYHPKPEAEIERCEVFNKNRLLFAKRDNGSACTISFATNNPDFIGYEYENKEIGVMPRATFDTDNPAEIPVAVLFRRNNG